MGQSSVKLKNVYLAIMSWTSFRFMQVDFFISTGCWKGREQCCWLLVKTSNTLSSCTCLCNYAIPECPGGSGPEEPRNRAAEDSRLCGPGRGASGRAPLCRVGSKERRVSSGILSVPSGSSLLLSVKMVSSKTLSQIKVPPLIKKVSVHWRFKFKLRRHSQHSFFEMNSFYSNRLTVSIPLLLKLNYFFFVGIIFLLWIKIRGCIYFDSNGQEGLEQKPWAQNVTAFNIKIGSYMTQHPVY